MRLSPRRNRLITGAWLVQVLSGSRSCHDCIECGGRMFVKASSGLCPLCFTRRRERRRRLNEIVQGEARAAIRDWAPIA